MPVATTTHYSLKTPALADNADIGDISSNFTALDAALWDLSNNTVNAAATTEATSAGAGAIKTAGGIYAAKKIYGSQVYNAVWNDYAEYRNCMTDEPGRCVTELGGGLTGRTWKRHQRGCHIISDTFGSCMGDPDGSPVCVAGRVLAFPFKDRKRFRVGDAVCSAPDGTVDRMGRLETILFPDRIIGFVSEIPEYEEWQAGSKEDPKSIPVNGRIWICVR